MAIFGTNTNYILSKKIKVFPTNFRGTYSTNTRNLINDVNIETYGFDPEAKLTTEKNLISLPGNSFGNDSYIIDYTIPDSTGAGKYTLKFVVGGYYFEIFDDDDFLADLSGKCFSIKTKSVQLTTSIDTTSATQNLLTTNNTYDSSRETTQLMSWIDDDDDLDHYDEESSDNYFTGIYVSNEVGEDATASLENIVLQKNSEYILNKNLCRTDIRSGLGNNSVRLTPKTGSKATGDNSLAAGYNTEASGKNSAAFGSNTVANQNNQFVIGKANVSPTTSSTLFIIGDGEINEAGSDREEVTNRKNIVEINSAETKISPKLSVVDIASKDTATYFTTAVDNTSISSNTVSIEGLTSTTISGSDSTLTLSNGNANLNSRQTIIGNTLSNIITDSSISLNSSESIKLSSKNISLNTASNKYFSLTNSIATLSINNIKLDGDITATGTTTISGSTTINGTTNITNTLTVAGATTLNNTLNVGKKLTANNDVQITNGNLVLGSNTQSSATIYLTSTGSETGFLSIDSYNLTLSKGSTLTISSNEITLSLSGTTASSHLTLTKDKLYSNVPIDAYLEKTLPDSSNSYTDYIIADDGKNKFKLSIGNQDYTNIIRTQTGANKLYSTKEIADLFTLNPKQIAKVYSQATQNGMITTKSTVNKGSTIGISSLSLDKILYSNNITDLKKLATSTTSTISCFQNAFVSENPSLAEDKYNMFIFKSKNKANTKQFIAINANGNTVTDDLVVNNTLAIGPADSSGKYKVAINTDQLGNVNFDAENLKIGQTTISKTAIVVDNGTIEAASFNATSDARLKENLVPYTPKKSILDLPIYKYNFIGKDETHIGCLAQDLEKICPELVSKGNNGYLSIKETKLVYLLLMEVKKLKAELEEIKNK